MKFFKALVTAAVVSAVFLLAPAQAADEPVTIGFIGTLSTPAGYMGQDELDAFKLAIKQGEDGKLGGVPVKLDVVDDGFKPSTGKRAARRMLQDGVRLFTGVNFSNVLVAVVPTVLKKDGFYVSLNAGPTNFAGKNCQPNFFSAAMHNANYSITSAMAANQLDADSVVLLALGYQAGRDAVEGFKSAYKGDVKATIYAKTGQSDFSVEIARIRSLQPDAVFTFLPGGPGINFAKQFANAGLKDSIKVISSLYSMDYHMLQASGDAGVGYYLTTLWLPGLDNSANKAFVKAFEDEYGRRPTAYAATAYDTALLIGSALKAVDGDFMGKPDAFRAALAQADFDSIRGDVSFGSSHYAVQDWYLVKVVKNEDGELDYKLIETIAKDQGDPKVAMCDMGGK